MKAWQVRFRDEAQKHDLRPGDAHPETGLVWLNGSFVTAEAHTEARVKTAIYYALKRAREDDLPFDLTPAWFKSVWPANGRCEVLPYIKLAWGDSSGRSTSPSIDRIFPDRGYVQTNCRIISNRANTLKSNATSQEMELILADLRKHESAH